MSRSKLTQNSRTILVSIHAVSAGQLTVKRTASPKATRQGTATDDEVSTCGYDLEEQGCCVMSNLVEEASLLPIALLVPSSMLMPLTPVFGPYPQILIVSSSSQQR
jgi:hypothetical protein